MSDRHLAVIGLGFVAIAGWGTIVARVAMEGNILSAALSIIVLSILIGWLIHRASPDEGEPR